MHLRGDSVREIPFMLFLGLLFAVCSALSVTVGYGLVRASDSRE